MPTWRENGIYSAESSLLIGSELALKWDPTTLGSQLAFLVGPNSEFLIEAYFDGTKGHLCFEVGDSAMICFFPRRVVFMEMIIMWSFIEILFGDPVNEVKLSKNIKMILGIPMETSARMKQKKAILEGEVITCDLKQKILEGKNRNSVIGLLWSAFAVALGPCKKDLKVGLEIFENGKLIVSKVKKLQKKAKV